MFIEVNEVDSKNNVHGPSYIRYDMVVCAFNPSDKERPAAKAILVFAKTPGGTETFNLSVSQTPKEIASAVNEFAFPPPVSSLCQSDPNQVSDGGGKNL